MKSKVYNCCKCGKPVYRYDYSYMCGIILNDYAITKKGKPICMECKEDKNELRNK